MVELYTDTIYGNLFKGSLAAICARVSEVIYFIYGEIILWSRDRTLTLIFVLLSKGLENIGLLTIAHRILTHRVSR